mmetsp:Transcript_51330/g.159112  ORF Transcript_51330/g.159112 Transcript_51330/m.159112 type:complete len:204 (-) Transcript_51330:36-647(-)
MNFVWATIQHDVERSAASYIAKEHSKMFGKPSYEDLEKKIKELEAQLKAAGGAAPKDNKKAKVEAAAPAKAEAEAEDDFDLFGDDDEEAAAEAEKVKEERIAAYKAKKAAKPTLIAKSNIILDVKPWGDDTDLVEMERLVRTIERDGLLWGVAKFKEIGYGIKKLVIAAVVEDDKVGTDFLEEEITKFEDYVQSVDVAAFQKV